MNRSEREYAYDLATANVDSTTGVLRGVTALQAGVQAKGKYVMLDAAGMRTLDPKQMKTKIPVFTDETTLTTLLGAAQDAKGRVKVRSDHDDSLASRAGFATNFVRCGDRVLCDIYLNTAYRDRDTVLETAVKTPDLIGCSIDFLPDFEIQNGKALMRVSDLSAVDLVDEGAVTPGGLFMSSRVDNENKDSNAAPAADQPDSLTSMASDKKNPPTIDECMAAITEMAGKLAEFNAAMASLKAAPAPATLSAVNELNEKLAAVKTQQEQLAAAQATFITEQNAKLAALSKERAALGLKAGEAKPLAEGAEPEAERARLAAEKAKDTPKTYLQLVAEKKAEGKLSASDCHRYVMNAHPDVYAAHQRALGMVKPPVA